MPDSIREKIIANVEAGFASITPGGGYNNTIQAKNVHRSAQGVPQVLALPNIVIAVEDAPLEVMSQDIVNRAMTLTATINAGPQGTTLAKNIETYVADLAQWMAADPTRGGNACTTSEPTIDEPDFSEVFQDHARIALTWQIIYQVKRTNPNLAA